MKKFGLVLLLTLGSTQALAAEIFCGIEVKDENVIVSVEKDAVSVNFVRALAKADNGVTKECFSSKGAIVVSIFPNGDVRAFVF